MTQNSAPEIGSTGIVDAPIGGREIPLDQFTNPEYASQPHNKAFTFLEGSLLDPDLEDQDRPALNKEKKETPEQYEERLLKGVEEALQPNVDDTISPEGAWARSKLLTMGQDGPDMKDLAMAVDARRVLRQQAEWQKQRDALHRRITRERYVAEHVFSEDDGLETTSGKLKSLTEAGSAGMEKARESILLDRIAHEIARNALMSVPDNAIVELPELRGVKGVPAVRDFLRTIAHDVALSGKDISYESVRAEIQRRMEDRDPSTSELKISVNSPASKELLTARSMLDAQFNKTMIAAMQRVRGMRGAADMASAPSEAFGDTNPSVMRAVEVLKNIPRNQDGIQQLMQEQGILARALEQFGSPRRYTRVDHEKRDDKDPGYEMVSESDEEYISRNRDSLSRLTQQLALNFNDYALKGTDWMMRMKSPKNIIDAIQPPATIRDKAFEQNAGGATDGKSKKAGASRTPSRVSTGAKKDTTPATSEPKPTSLDEHGDDGTKAGGVDPEYNDGGEDESSDDASEDDGTGGTGSGNGTGEGQGTGEGKGNGTENEGEQGDKKDETLPAAPGDENGDGKKGDGEGTGTGDQKDEPLHTSARVAFVALKDAGADNVDNIARFAQNIQHRGWFDTKLAGVYKVPFLGGLTQSFVHPVRSFWQGLVIKGNMDSIHLRFAAGLRKVAKDITSTDASVPFELTEDVVAKALDGAKAMRAQEGWFKRNIVRGFFRNTAHALTGLVQSPEMIRAQEWLAANGQQLLKDQKAATLAEQTALAERFTLQGDDADVLSTGLGEGRAHIDASKTEYQAAYTQANTDLKGLIEQYANGTIATEDAFLKAVNAYVHDTLAGKLPAKDQEYLTSTEFASNMLPIANEIKTRKAAYFADAKDGSGTAFSKLNLDITIGSGVWGGARSVEKSGKFGVSIREKLAHRLADQPSGFKSGALTEAYGTVRNLPRWGAFGTVGYYAGMFGAGLLPMPARTISRMAGIGGIAALGGIREGGITWSNNGRLMGLGGKTTEKVAQTSYELARGRKSSPDAALMQQMEGLMVHREKAEGLTTAITALSGKTELTADEAKTLLTAVAHAKARIGLTDQSVTRPDSKARRVFDLATPNNFIEFSEGGENRQYMALRKAIIDGQIALARGKHADHLDEAVLVMQGQLAKGNDQEGIKEWLVTQGKTEAEAAQMVTTQFVDKGITPDQGMNKRMTALAKYSWRKGFSAAGRAVVFGTVASPVMHAAGEVVHGVVTAPGPEIQHFQEVGGEAYWADWKDVLDGHVDPKDVLQMGTDAQGNAIVETSLSHLQQGALLAHHSLGEAGNNALELIDKITPGDTFHTEMHMSAPIAMGDGVNISLPDDVHHFVYNDPIPVDGPHDVIFDGRNGHVYDLTHDGVNLGLHDFDGDGKLDLAVDDGANVMAATELTKAGEPLHGFTFHVKEGTGAGHDYEVGGPCTATLTLDGQKIDTVIPTGTQWIIDSHGNPDLVLASDHSVVLMNDVSFGPDGAMIAPGDGSILDALHFTNEIHRISHHSEGTLNPDGTINPESVWGRSAQEVNHHHYFSENNSHLGVHTIKDENGALIFSMQEAARRSGHIADAVYGNKEHGFYFTLGHQHDQGIYIPAYKGIAKLDPHDTTTTYSYTRPDGTTGTITNADLFNSLVNKKVFDGLDKGDVGFELHHHRDALNLNDGVNNGHYEAVIVGQHADGTLEHEIVATGIGSSSASEGIDFTEQSAIAHITAQSHTERIFEVIPPLHLPEDVPGVEGSPASLEFALFAAPTYLDKERSITGDTAGKVSNIPQGVSFAGGDVVDSPLPKPKTGDGTGTGDETGKKDESGDETDDDGTGEKKDKTDKGETKNSNEQVAEMKARFTERLGAHLEAGKITADQLAAVDFNALGLVGFSNLTVEQAHEILDDVDTRAEFVDKLWNALENSHKEAYIGATPKELIDQLIEQSAKELREEDSATSGLSEAQKRLLDIDLAKKFDQAKAELDADPRYNIETQFKQAISTITRGAEVSDDQLREIVTFYSGFLKQVTEERAKGTGSDAQNIENLLSQMDIAGVPAFLRDNSIIRQDQISGADGKLTEVGKAYIRGIVQMMQTSEQSILSARITKYSAITGVALGEVPSLLDVDRVALAQMVVTRARNHLMNRQEYVDGLSKQVEVVEGALGIEVEVSGDAAGGDDASGDDGTGGTGGGAGGTGGGTSGTDKPDEAAGATGTGGAGGGESGKGEGADTEAESGTVVGSEKAKRVKQEIFEKAGKRTAEEAVALIKGATESMKEQAARGKGKLQEKIEQMASETELFVDGKVAYIPRTAGTMITVGDLHGDSASLEHILDKAGFIENMENGPKDKVLVFMGDYVDRGPQSIRVMEILMDLRMRYPNNIIIMKGDHEDRNPKIREKAFSGMVTRQYGADGRRAFDTYRDMFDVLPRMVVTANGAVIGHGGPAIRPDGYTPGLIEVNTPPKEGRISFFEVMEWADPIDAPSAEKVFVAGNGMRNGRFDRDKKAFVPGDPQRALESGLILYHPRALQAFLDRVGGKVFIRGHEESSDIRFKHRKSNFHGKLMQVHSTGMGPAGTSPETWYKRNLATYGEFGLQDDITEIDYDKNQKLVWD